MREDGQKQRKEINQDRKMGLKTLMTDNEITYTQQGKKEPPGRDQEMREMKIKIHIEKEVYSDMLKHLQKTFTFPLLLHCGQSFSAPSFVLICDKHWINEARRKDSNLWLESVSSSGR